MGSPLSSLPQLATATTDQSGLPGTTRPMIAGWLLVTPSTTAKS
ncbi:MAG: hypothetical protein AB4426_10010 [Xenococcaceae cyanobacterium]